MASILKKILSIFKIKSISTKISITYAVLGFIWVYFSNKFIYKYADGNYIQFIISTRKGFIFIFLTAIILYFILNKIRKKLQLLEKNLDRNEKKLSDSEAINKAIIKAIPDLLFMLDDKGYFIDCIANDENLLFTPMINFMGKNIMEVLPKEISEIAYEKIKLVLKTGLLESFQYSIEISQKILYFELRMVKYSENQILAIAQDITEKKQNELKLKINEEKYKTLVNEMHQGLALFEGSFNNENKIIYKLIDANESYEKLIGLKREEILGKTILQIFPSVSKDLIRKIEMVAETGKSMHYERYLHEANKYYEVIAYKPKMLQYVTIITDITERKLAEEALKTSESNFRNIFENSSDAILIVKDDKIIDCNQAMVNILGIDSKANIVNKNPFLFYPEMQPDGESSKEKAERVRNLTLKEGKCRFEWWYKRSDGSIMPVEVMLTTLIQNGEKIFHSLWRDISERKKIENELEFLSYHDQLTGLYNRRFFSQELERLDVADNLPLSIIMADVNGLKLVNDSFGHAIGDELIKRVADVIKKGCKGTNIAARLGGDEFVIILPRTGIKEAEEVVNKINSLAAKEKIGAVQISISFGYGVKEYEDQVIHEVLKKAEDHMYNIKLFEGPNMRGKTINAIVDTLNEKSKREKQHSKRVSELCELMGKALNLTEVEIKELKTVGLLHDIGNIAIEEDILNKKDKLTQEEWKEIIRHPEIGYRILNTVNDMKEIAQYVLCHHERWDGKGYPKGLKGEEIPLQSRIISIVGTYDTLTSERSYRHALTKDEAILELKKNAGTQFDPDLINLFINTVLKNYT